MTLSTPLLAAAPLLAGLLGPALLGAAPGPRQADRPVTTPVHAAEHVRIVEHVAARTSAEQRRVLDYWTPERMARALPIGLLDLVTGDKGLLGGLTGRPATPSTRGMPDEAAAPRAKTRLAASNALRRPRELPVPQEVAASKLPMPRHQAAAGPKATTIGSRWDAGGAVARTTGRVFMTVGGADFVCSASTVRSANRDVVITAGHCVKDGTGQWAANWTFVPGYGTRGQQPYGRYAARRMFVAEPWSREGDDDHDVAMVALATSGGRHVADVVGAQEIAFNAPRGGQAFGFGYPADPPYNGGHLVYCAGRLKDDPYGQTRDQGLGCDMTAGSSGGPWMTSFDVVTGKGTITSLSSFKYSDDPRTMYGPYLGDAAKALFTTAERA
ncbi:trypsin-like serine peptidase [Nonomuraea sp. SYSU D8015]|uniref:trypsin-like serine peptidase n=1 Tax=Nonomuraea sp. SYSU D8015 TaxID=2593644 RepID=UPI001CB6BC12|nr:trypsin-like serine protease [Nonomuraea sp. SYSU D8015]